MNFDLTPIIQAVIALCAVLITTFVIPWVKSKVGEQNTDNMLAWVTIAVQAAEQLYTSTDGAAKKEYVLNFLEEKGFEVDTDEIDLAIESAVLSLHTALYGAEKTEGVGGV